MPPVLFFPRATVLVCGARRTTLGVFTGRRAALRLERISGVELAGPTDSADEWLVQTTGALVELRTRVRRGTQVTLVLPAHLLLTKMLRVPGAAPVGESGTVREAAEQSIPLAAEAVVWGSVPAGAYGTGSLELLTAARRELVEALCDAAWAAGLVPVSVLPAPLALLAGSRLALPPNARPVLVIECGTRSTQVLQFDAGTFAARSCALGIGRPGAPVAAVADDGDQSGSVVQEVLRTLLYFHREYGLRRPERVHLVGGGAGTGDLLLRLESKLALPVTRLEVPDAVRCAPGIEPGSVETDEEQLTHLVGAAATVLIPKQPKLSLVPVQFRARIRARRRQTFMAAGAAGLVLVLLPPLVHFDRSIRGLRDEIAIIDRQLAPLRQRDSRQRENRRQLAALEEQVAALKLTTDRRDEWLRFLADLHGRLTLVGDVWLDRLAVDAGTGKQHRLVLAGRMLDRKYPSAKIGPESAGRVAALLASLGGSPFVGAVEGEWFETSEPGILKFGFVLVPGPQVSP